MIELAVTPEIRLSQISLSNAHEIFNTIDTQREYLGVWLPFVPFTKTIDDTISFISSVIDAPPDRAELVFVIYYQNTFAGIIGFRDTDRLNRKTELGYWLSQPFQGKGIIIQSVKRLIEYAFAEMEMNRIQIRCAVGNHSSKKIPQQLGFLLERIERDGELLANAEYTDLEVYSMLKKEYSNQHN
ncbi:MAG: GNAT family protein [Tenuifilaceae bacterium]|jgi:ribosomal-protein-serine acetyltransferase|nr:GNAT family protein [Tenuifilaceae bacterium]